ncbi:MAG: MSCRAMM family protein, partial [Planctomycetota bacterium]
RSGSSGADRKYQGVVVSPDEIAAITFGEKPHEITFKNVAVHFPDRPQRTYPEFLDRMAEKLDLTGLSPEQLSEYRFKSPQKAIDVIDIVRGGQHIHHAFEAIKHSRPKVKISGLDQTTQNKIRRAAANWAGAGYLRKYGIELGLMGRWPEFFDMAVARLSEEPPSDNYPFDLRSWTQDNASIARVMANYRMDTLTVDQVSKLKQVIRKTDSGSVLTSFFWYLKWTKSQATTDALWELAQDDRPWIWWPAIEEVYIRSTDRRAMFDGLSEKMKIRLLLINERLGDENLKAKSLVLLREIFTPELGTMASQVWTNVRRKISQQLDKKLATEIYIDYLRRMQSEMSIQQWVSDRSNAEWKVAYIIRNLNVWYGVNIANLGDDPDAQWSEPRIHSEFSRLIDEVLVWYDGNPNAEPVESTFYGRVIDTRGKPIAGAEISFAESQEYQDPRWGRQDRMVDVGRRTTDADGRFSFNGYGNSSHQIFNVTANGFLPKERLTVDRMTDGRYRYRERATRENNVIQLQRPGKISGTAIAADGKPLANAELRLSAANPYSQKDPITTVTTDSEGKFAAEDIASGPFLLSYADLRRVPHGRGIREVYGGLWGAVRLETAEAGQLTDIVLDLSKSVCALEVEVVRESGEPATEISFTLDAAMEGGTYPYAPIFHVTRASNDGVYRFEGMPPGARHLRLSYPQGGKHTELDIELTPVKTARYRVVCEPLPARAETLASPAVAGRQIEPGRSDAKLDAPRRIFLPDMETPDANAVLDLATGRMLSVAGLENDDQYFRKLGKGDLVYEYARNEAWLICLRGAKMQPRTDQEIKSVTPGVERQDFTGYLLENVPCQYQVTTAEGDKYELKVLSVEKGDNGRVQIEYRKANATSGIGPEADIPGPEAVLRDRLEAEIREIESLCAPAKGTLRHAVERRYGKGIAVSSADDPSEVDDPASRYRVYEFFENESLLVCYDGESLAEVISARYVDPRSLKGRDGPPTDEEQLRELKPRLKQMQRILAEYTKRFGEDKKAAWGKATDDVRVRLRDDRRSWPAGSDPSFQFDIANKSRRTLYISYPQSFKVEVDGQWHEANYHAYGRPRSIGTGSQMTYSLLLGDFLPDGAERLSAGKHTVRAALFHIGERDESSEDEKTPIRFGARKFEATSNPVEIEVVAEYAPWGENFDGDLGGPSLTIAEFRPPAGERDAGSGPLQPDDILPPILGYDVKLNFADPVSRDGSFHGEQSVVFSLSFHKIEALQTDILFGRLLVGQTTWPVQFKDDTVTFKDGSSGKTIRTETWSKKERQFDLVLPLPLTYGKKRYVCPVHI